MEPLALKAKEQVMPCATILGNLLTTTHTQPALPILHLGLSWTKLALEKLNKQVMPRPFLFQLLLYLPSSWFNLTS
jgi:hypothetical protein